MSLIGKLFGGGDTISKGLDLIDSWHTSTPELLEAQSKAKATLLQAYAPFKLAQRYIAFTFVGLFCFTFLMALLMTVFGFGNPTGIKDLADEYYLGEITLLIVTFYFGGGFAEGALNARNKS